MKQRVVFVVGWVVASGAWLVSVQHVFAPPPRAALVHQLAVGQRRLVLADDTDERMSMRRLNPEWDLMSRTFAVLAFSNLALAEPDQKRQHLEVVDALIEQTLRDEREHGQQHFLLGYARRAPFVDPAQRSLFVDGEVALMLAARQVVERQPAQFEAFHARIEEVSRQLTVAPKHLAESYPDEGWTFCNSIAVASLRLAEVVDGRSRRPLIDAWLTSARQHLIDPSTGLLRSSFRVGGAVLDGPEGSTLWLSAHMLALVDRPFAEQQYRLARASLGHLRFGFGWASEWPAASGAHDDIDSGPTIPFVEANAGSSGLAVLGAAAFEDEAFLNGLLTSLELAAFPERRDGALRYAAGNQLADAVVLAALVEGPLWRRVGAASIAGVSR